MPEITSWKGVMADKLFNISFKGRPSKMWRMNSEELPMKTELNFFKRMGENDTGAHTILVASMKKKKQKNLLCWRAIKNVWRCWKTNNSNGPWRAVSYHHQRGLRGDLRKTTRYIHGRKAKGNTGYLNLEKKGITWASAQTESWLSVWAQHSDQWNRFQLEASKQQCSPGLQSHSGSPPDDLCDGAQSNPGEFADGTQLMNLNMSQQNAFASPISSHVITNKPFGLAATIVPTDVKQGKMEKALVEHLVSPCITRTL